MQSVVAMLCKLVPYGNVDRMESLTCQLALSSAAALSTLVLTGSEDGQVRLWNATTHACIYECELLGSSLVRFRDRLSDTPRDSLMVPPVRVHTLSLMSSGSHLLVGSSDGFTFFSNGLRWHPWGYCGVEQHAEWEKGGGLKSTEHTRAAMTTCAAVPLSGSARVIVCSGNSHGDIHVWDMTGIRKPKIWQDQMLR